MLCGHTTHPSQETDRKQLVESDRDRDRELGGECEPQIASSHFEHGKSDLATADGHLLLLDVT